MVPAIIAASVSLLLFLLGQWWLMRTSQTAFYRSKLEELWLALNEISEASRFPQIEEDWADTKVANAIMEQAILLTNSKAKSHMLTHLYFPEAVPRFDDIVVASSALSEFLGHYIDCGGTCGIEPSFPRVERLLTAVNSLKNFLRDEQGYLTFRVSHRW